MDVRRKSFKRPGWDCDHNPCGVRGCGTRPGAGHGIHSEEWHYVVGAVAGDVAVSIAVITGRYPETVEAWRASTSLRCYDITTHVNFPTSSGEFSKPGSLVLPDMACDYVEGGRCHMFQTSSLEAKRFDELIDLKAFEQPETLWAALEAEFLVRVEEARAARVVVCSHCAGRGFDAKGTPS